MWGSPESLREIKALVSLMEQAQATQLPAMQAAASQAGGGVTSTAGGAQPQVAGMPE